MLPLGNCVLLWRNHLGLTQAALAQKTGLPRPNLSDIERGRREVSLRTLRALAFGLGIRPGILADGIGPGEMSKPLSRESLERVAESMAGGPTPKNQMERELAEELAPLVRSRLSASSGRRQSPARSGKKADAAWLRLSASHSRPEIRSLAERAAEKARRP